VITSTAPRFSDEQQQDISTSEAQKGAEVEAIKQQKKASEIMAERLPGLTDPNAPAASPASAATPGTPNTGTPTQPGAAPVAPPAPKLLPARHPDRFTPGAAPSAGSGAETPAPPEAPRSQTP